MAYRAGRHFLQLPGPSDVPARVLRALSRPTIDHRGPQFQQLATRVLTGVKGVFRTGARVFLYPSSATGAWEAALRNTLAAGDQVLAVDQGFFARKWAALAERLGLSVERLDADWRRPVDPDAIRRRLERDDGSIRAVLIVHNETSTGVTTPIEPIRRALDTVAHGALLMVDAVSSLVATDYRHDEWGVDVSVAGSQKALMLPPGISFTAVSARALQANAGTTLPRGYWSWDEMVRFNDRGFFPYTPATNLLFGLDEALRMLEEEGLEQVFARHARHAQATRRAVAAWGLETYCLEPEACSNAATTVCMPPDVDAEALRRTILERFDMSLGKGLGPLEGNVFRIGHLGDLNDLTLMGAISGVEMGMRAEGVPHRPGGAQAALEFLAKPDAA